MSIFSRIFRKREKQKNPDGSKTVIVRDRFGNVRKIKHRDAAGYKQKQFFNRDCQLTKRKAKGPGMRRYKAKRRNFQNVSDQEFQPGRSWLPPVQPNDRIGNVQGYQRTNPDGSMGQRMQRDPYRDLNVDMQRGGESNYTTKVKRKGTVTKVKGPHGKFKEKTKKDGTIKQVHTKGLRRTVSKFKRAVGPNGVL